MKIKNSPSLIRDQLMNAINAEGIPCFSGSCSAIYREKAFTAAGLGPAAALPVSKELSDTSLMFLVHPTLHESNITKTIEVAKNPASLASLQAC